MSRIIELPDDLYRDLESVARDQGLTPADWIAATLPSRSGASGRQELYGLLEGLIGAVDSAKEPWSGEPITAFGELIARKFEKQGLRGR
jgi:hypothetical protein